MFVVVVVVVDDALLSKGKKWGWTGKRKHTHRAQQKKNSQNKPIFLFFFLIILIVYFFFFVWRGVLGGKRGRQPFLLHPPASFPPSTWSRLLLLLRTHGHDSTHKEVLRTITGSSLPRNHHDGASMLLLFTFWRYIEDIYIWTASQLSYIDGLCVHSLGEKIISTVSSNLDSRLVVWALFFPYFFSLCFCPLCLRSLGKGRKIRKFLRVKKEEKSSGFERERLSVAGGRVWCCRMSKCRSGGVGKLFIMDVW